MNSDGNRGDDLAITGLTADSRQVKPGFLFAALPGTLNDGRNYIKQAVDAGARVILTTPDVTPTHIGNGATLIADSNPRRKLALIAARFYGSQPDFAVCVTGTNGKSSVAGFLYQIWKYCNLEAGVIGTLGVRGVAFDSGYSLTSPDPVTLHHVLAKMSAQNITHVAMEASSHGLAQNRLDGVQICAGAFTNLTRDHLDYHSDFDSYRAAKMRLFRELLPEKALAMANHNVQEKSEIAAIAKERSLYFTTYGLDEGDVKCLQIIQIGRSVV